MCVLDSQLSLCAEYDTMDVPMLKEVIQMLRQQLDKAQVDRNYVQHERVSSIIFFISA